MDNNHRDHRLIHAKLEQLVPNTIMNGLKKKEASTMEYRMNTNIQKQRETSSFHADNNRFNVFEYQQGHPNHINKGSERHPLISRPYTPALNQIYSPNDVVQRTLDKMVNVSGQMIRNGDLKITKGRSSA